MSRGTRVLLVVFALVGLVAAACGGGDDGGEAADGADAATTTGVLPGATSITEPPAENGELPTVQELQADPDDPMNADPIREGQVRYRYAYGPIEVKSGQNNI